MFCYFRMEHVRDHFVDCHVLKLVSFSESSWRSPMDTNLIELVEDFKGDEDKCKSHLEAVCAGRKV